MAERFGRYTLLKRLGAGGMGEVFLARPAGAEGTDHFVVVKTLLPSLAEDEELVMMFLSEARLAAQLDHPNICRVLDLGLEDGVLFMALELIRGVDLEKLQKDLAGELVPVPQAVRIIADAAKGLHHAHELKDKSGTLVGLIHRDVSPHNLLVKYDGEVKVIDFGLAKTVGRAQQSHTGSLKGKFAYLSPEQVRAERLDRRIDVFALGIVLWELLTGQRLFRRDDGDVATLAAIAQCDVPAPSSQNPKVPPGLDALVFKALARERADRFQSAQELGEALEGFLVAHGQGAKKDLAAWMRSVYREQLEREATKGLLADAPDGPVMKLRRSVKPRADVAKSPAVRSPATPASEAMTEEALFGPDGTPLAKGSVLLAPRPEVTTQRTRLAAAPPVRASLARVPPPVPMGSDDDLDPEEKTIPVPGAGGRRASPVRLSAAPRLDEDSRDDFTQPTQKLPELRPREAKTAPLTPRIRPAPPTTVPLAPAPTMHDTAHDASRRRWIALGIGLAVLVVAAAVVLIAAL